MKAFQTIKLMPIMKLAMTKTKTNQAGFIPMMIALVAVLLFAIWIVYTRVHTAQG